MVAWGGISVGCTPSALNFRLVESRRKRSVAGVTLAMAASALPTAVELAGLNDLAAVVRFTGLEPVTWRQVNLALGNWPNLRLLSQAPPDGIAEALATMQLPRLGGDGNPVDPPEMRELTMVETVQIALIWRIARQTYGMEDIDIGPRCSQCHQCCGASYSYWCKFDPSSCRCRCDGQSLGHPKDQGLSDR